MDGAFYLTLALLPHMRQRKQGLVIFVNSISGQRATPLGGIAYVAAKFGLRERRCASPPEERPTAFASAASIPASEHADSGGAAAARLEEHRQAILQSEDVAAAILYIASQPAHVSIPELVITPFALCLHLRRG